jgi:hypothetical protein
MGKKTTGKRTRGSDLMSRIQITSRLVADEAGERGLARYLEGNGQATIKPMTSCPGVPEGCWMSHFFQPLHGVRFELLSMVTDDTGSSPLVPAQHAARLADWMEWLTPRAAAVAAQRTAVTAAAAQVIAEATAEGIDMELLGVDLAPVHTTVAPGERGGWHTVFYVRIVMDHLDQGVLTRDAYTIDADDPTEFADYMRRRILPEIRADRARYQQIVIA